MEQTTQSHIHSINNVKMQYDLNTPELEQPLLEVRIQHQRAGMNYLSGRSHPARVSMCLQPITKSAPSSDGISIVSFTGFSGIGFTLEEMPRKRPKRMTEWFNKAVKKSEEIREIFVRIMSPYTEMSPSTPGYSRALEEAAREIQALMRKEE